MKKVKCIISISAKNVEENGKKTHTYQERKMSHYKKIVKPKAKGRPSNVPAGICRYCKKKITKEDRLYYTAGLVKRECKPCRRKVSREANRKRTQIIKDNPLW